MNQKKYFDFGYSACQAEELSKIYVTPDQVLITPETIYVYSKNRIGFLEVSLWQLKMEEFMSQYLSAN